MPALPAMTKRERIAATLRGQPVDRPAWSLWRHFYDKETTPARLAGAMLAFQRAHDFDFMKVNPRASYHVEDWGLKLRFSGQPHVKPVVLDYPVKTVADWARLTVLPPDRGVLGEHLEALRLIGAELRGEVPFIQTIFTPLSLAGDLVRDDAQLVHDLRTSPDAVHAALEVITETFVAFARAALDVGASGIFLATTSWASRDTITEAEYAEFGRPDDLRILDAVRGAELNVLHVCAEHNMLFALADYPVHAINWATTSPTNPSLAEAAARLDKALIGGITRDVLSAPTPDVALAEARRAREQTGGRRWMLGPTCSISTDSRPESIEALRAFVGMRLAQ